MSAALFLLLAISPEFVFSYNVDTSYPIVYTDPEPGGSNHFGYTVSLSYRKSSNPSSSLFVGAPQTSNGVGRVYRCTEIGTGNQARSSCRGLNIDPASAPNRVRIPGERVDIITMKSGGLGVSMATRGSSNFTVCAPHSLVTPENIRNPAQFFVDDMCGYCYDVPDALGDILYRDNDILRSTKRYPINTDVNSLYGFSVDYAVKKDSKSVERIIGQPRLNRVEIKHGHRTFTKSLIIDDRAHLGYSVSSGYFFDSNQLLFVAGAPGWFSEGRVMIYDLNSNKERSIEGSVLGEYFGASLATGDFDGDGLDDLAVGAPHWGEVDFGRVYTFYGNGDVSHPMFTAGLMLQGASGYGQFGYTLAAADLDSDGRTDLIVSAPWEASGVVYVFYGHPDFRKQDSSARIIQRIEPSEFKRQLQVQRFGFSLSADSVDIDENGYPDLAIGAYKSGHAVVLRSRPVIKTEVRLVSYPSALDNSKTTQKFVVSVCVKYEGKKAPNNQEFWFSMTIDADHKRVEGGPLKEFAAWFPHNQSQCHNETLSLMDGIQIFLAPIVIDVKHRIREREGNGFCSSCPVLSGEGVRKSVQLTIPFSTGCTDGIICNANLSVDARFGGTGEDNEWVVGSGDISLNLIVMNEGEPAYLTELIVDIPPGIRLRNAIPLCKESLKEGAVSLFCDIDNPLAKDAKKSLNISLDMGQVVVPVEGSELIFNITRLTRSVDYGKDNPTMLSLKVKNEAYFTLTGVTNKESVEYGRTENKSKVPIRHTYQVFKNGTTPIGEARLTIDVPTSMIGRNNSFLNISDPKLFKQLTDNSRGTDGCFFDNLSFNYPGDGLSQEWQLHSVQRNRRQISGDSEKTDMTVSSLITEEETEMHKNEMEPNDTNTRVVTHGGHTTDQTIYLNCSTDGVSCIQIICVFSLPKQSDDMASVTVDMVFDVNEFYSANEDSLTVAFNTNANVEIITPYISDPTYIRNNSATVSTMLYNQLEPQKLAAWILPSSIVLGILLFCILAIILLKVGFFNRPKKVEIAKAKEMEMTLKTDTGDGERYG